MYNDDNDLELNCKYIYIIYACQSYKHVMI